MDELIITVRLTTAQVNLVLHKLGQCPYVEVAEIIGLIKSQGDAALTQARHQAQQLAEAPGNGLDQVKQGEPWARSNE